MVRFSRFPFAGTGDSLSDDAPDDPYGRWIAGVVFAVIVAGLGIYVALAEHAYFIGGRPLQIVEYEGRDAISLGVALAGVGLFLHGHYFWTPSHRFYFISEILKPLSLITICGGIGYVVVNQFVFF